MATIPTNSIVPSLQVPSFSVPTYKVPTYKVPKLTVPGANYYRPKTYTPSPRKHVANLGDVILGGPFGTRQLQETLEDNNLGDLQNIPLLNKIVGAGLYAKERYVDPLFKGDIRTLAINGLESMGQDLDILANPVKALMPWAGGGTAEDFLKSMGWVGDEYRQQYQWDTGNFLVDLVGEIASDPLTWLSFGATKAVGKGSDVGADLVRKSVAAKYGEEVAEEISERTYREIAKDIAEKLYDPNSDLSQELLKRVSNNRAKLLKQLEGISIDSPEYLKIAKSLNSYDTMLTDLSKIKNLSDVVSDIRYTDQFRKFNAAIKFEKTVKTIDNTINFAAVGLNPAVGMGKLVMNHMIKPGFKHLWNYTIKQLKPLDINKIIKLGPQNIDVLNDAIAKRTKVLYKDKIAKFDLLLKSYNKTYLDIQNLYIKVLQNVPQTKLTKEYVDKKFLKELQKQIPELAAITASDVTMKQVNRLIANITPEDLMQFVDVVGQGACCSKVAYNKTLMTAINAVEEDMNKFFYTKSSGSFELDIDSFLDGKVVPKHSSLDEFDAVQKLKYIDERLLNVDGEHYGLAKLKEYMYAIKDLNPIDYTTKSALLDYFGINLKNYKTINTLLKKNDKATVDELARIMKAAKTGNIATTIFAYNRSKQTIENTLARVTPKIKYKTNGVVDDKLIQYVRKFQDENITKEAIAIVEQGNDLGPKLLDKQKELIETFYKAFPDHSEQLSLFSSPAAILVSQEDLELKYIPAFLNDLDTLFDYPAADVKNSEVLKRVLEFNLDNADATSLKTFKENLEALDRRLTGWKEQVTNRNAPNFRGNTISAESKQLILDLNNVMKSKDTKEFISALTDYLSANETYYSLIVSAQGRYALTALRIEANEDLVKWLDEISKTDSPARTKLMEACTVLSTKEGFNKQAADYIDRILATIDSTNNIAALLNTTFTSVDIPKAQLDFMRGELFNIIYSNRTNLVSEYLDGETVDVLVNKFMEELHKFNDDFILSPELKEVDNPNSLMKYFIDSVKSKASSGDIENMDLVYEEALNLYTETMTEVRANVKHAFELYVNNLNSMFDLHSTPIRMCMLWNDSDLISYMNQLGDEYLPILKALNSPDTKIYIEPVQDFISHVSGNVIKDDIREINAMLERVSTDTKEFLKDVNYRTDYSLNKSKDELAENSLAQTITKSYIDMNAINNKLLGDQKINLISANAFNEYLKENIGFINAFSWSTANGFLAVRKDLDGRFVNMHRLGGTYIKAQGAEALGLYSNFKTAYSRASKYERTYSSSYISKLREALTTVYRDSSITYGPHNPEMYFKEASARDILAWDLLTKNASFSNQETIRSYKQQLYKFNGAMDTPKFTIKDKINYYSDPRAVYKDIDELIHNPGFNDDNAWSDLVSNAPGEYLEDIYEGIESDLTKTIKDPASMQDNIFKLEQYIKHDVAAFNNMKKIGDISVNTEPIGNYVKKKKDVALLYNYGITPDLPINHPKVQRFFKEERCAALIESINSWTPAQLRSWIDHNTDGMTFIVDRRKRLNIMVNKEELEQAGLVIETLNANKRIYLIRRTNNEITNVPYKYVRPRYLSEDLQKVYTDSFIANREYFFTEGMDIPEEIFTGDLLNKQTYETIKERYIEQVGDLEKQKVYSKIDENGINTFYAKSNSRPNVAIIGDVDAQNVLLDECSEAFKARNLSKNYVTTDLSKSVFNGTLESIHRVNSAHKYLQLWFNDDFALNGPIFKKALADASDEEIEGLFKRNNFVACVLKEDRKGHPRVYKIYINNRKMLNDAIKQGAICVPHEVYRNMVLTVNKQVTENKWLNFYKQTIVGTYKTMYLTTPGFLMRNGFDSAIYKNAATSGGLEEIIKNVKYEYKANKLLEFYNDVQKKVFEEAKKNTGMSTFNRRYLRKVLKENYTKEQRDLYALIDIFMNSSASGGFSKAFEEHFLQYNLAHGAQHTTDFERIWATKVLNNPVSGKIQDVNSTIEQASRLGLFLKLVDEGGTPADAIRKVVETHFDYEIASHQLGLVEQVFWFSTFPINNMMYYMNYGITQNPSMLKLQMDMLELSWNDGTYTWDDLRNNNYLAGQALRGNIRFNLFGKDIILKLGSSVLDAYNLLVDPIGSAKERLNPFISVLSGVDKPSSLNPLTTQFNNMKTIASGRSYLPSVYTTLQQYKYRPYTKRYSNRQTYSNSVWTAIPKMKKVAKPKYQWSKNYRIYTKPYVFANKQVTYKWLTTTQGIAPYFLNINNKILSKDKRYRRQLRKINMPGLQ